MRRFFKNGINLLVLLGLSHTICADPSLQLWYETPARDWNQALPLGNGRSGVMFFGGIDQEHLQLNEDTFWAGSPNNNINAEMAPAVKEVQALVLARKYTEAQTLANTKLVSKTNQGMPYQTLGDLWIKPHKHDHGENYIRSLSLADAIGRVSYDFKGTHYQREIFTSFTDQVIAVRFSANQPKSINLDIGYSSPLESAVTTEGNRLTIRGKGSDHEGQEGKIRYYTSVQPIVEGGEISTSNNKLTIRNADSVVLYVSSATNYKNYKDLSIDPETKAQSYLENAQRFDYETLKQRHIAFYKSQFYRVGLSIDSKQDFSNVPTDKRIATFSKHPQGSEDNELVNLYFQYGRYLLISSSQPGTQPANLQGIWNDQPKGAWDSKYTVNINTEMNYWPAEPTNLSELHQPLFDMLQDLSITGQEAATKIYGARGWAMHHNTDIWRITGQVDPAFYGQWPMGGAWLCQHLWYHYLYTGDRLFLQKYYPVIKGAAEFFENILVKDPKTSWYVVAPSISPENAYIQEPRISIAAGNTMDNQLVFDLFSVAIDAANLLDIDKSFANRLASLRNKLPPMQVGQYGQLQEWLEDYDSPTDHHRHVSHLYGLFPSNQISATRTPELFSAAKKSLELRGDASTGWSMGWKINLWARLFDGEHAYKLLNDQIRLVDSSVSKGENGGTYPNLLDAHPPFQIDGNFGVTSGVTEMLLQSHDGSVHLLPALPTQWYAGSVRGLKTRGGFEVSFKWDKYKITELRVHSTIGGNLRIQSPNALSINGLDLKLKFNKNPNSFFATPYVKRQKKHNLALPLYDQTYYSFDIPTKAGDDLVFGAN